MDFDNCNRHTVKVPQNPWSACARNTTLPTLPIRQDPCSQLPLDFANCNFHAAKEPRNPWSARAPHRLSNQAIAFSSQHHTAPRGACTRNITLRIRQDPRTQLLLDFASCNRIVAKILVMDSRLRRLCSVESYRHCLIRRVVSQVHALLGAVWCWELTFFA